MSNNVKGKERRMSIKCRNSKPRRHACHGHLQISRSCTKSNGQKWCDDELLYLKFTEVAEPREIGSGKCNHRIVTLFEQSGPQMEGTGIKHSIRDITTKKYRAMKIKSLQKSSLAGLP